MAAFLLPPFFIWASVKVAVSPAIPIKEVWVEFPAVPIKEVWVVDGVGRATVVARVIAGLMVR